MSSDARLRPSPGGKDTGARRPAGPQAGWTRTVRSFLTDDNHVLYHLWTFVCGLSLVVPLCVGVIQNFALHLRYQPSGLGILSATTLAGYPVQQESYYYVLALVVLMLVPGIVWLAWLAFSLSLARALGRDFGGVAARGCWALTLFPVVFPYALLRPSVTFMVLAPTVVMAPLLQLLLVVLLPQRFDYELHDLRWVGKLQQQAGQLPNQLRRTLSVVFLAGTAGSWAVYLALAGRAEPEGVGVALMAMLVLSLPVLFLLGWVVWSQLWAGDRVPRLVHLVMGMLVGVGVTWYLYFRVGHPEVMLSALALVAALVLRPVVARWVRGSPRRRVPVVVAVVLLALVAVGLVTFEPADLTEAPSLNPDYLREDGTHLAWANDIRLGKLQGRDFYSMYGPLLDYGLVAVMKVVGVRAEAAPLYWWLGRVIGAAAAVVLLWELTGSALFAVLGILVLHLGVGWRTGPALLVLASFTHFARTRQVRWALVAGMLSGLALGLSHEFGLCVLIACGVATAVLAWRYETRRLAGKGLGALFVGTALAVAPLVAHFALSGGLGELLGDLVQHPRYVMLGYGNLPFPNWFSLLAQERPVWEVVAELLRGGRLGWYFPVVAWVVTLHLVLFRYVMGKATARDLGALMVMVFGVLAFRVTLARSDVIHLHLVLPVATVLFLWHLWLLVGRLGSSVLRPEFRVVRAMEVGLLSAATIFLVDAATLRGARVAVLGGEMRRAAGGLRPVWRHLASPSELARATVPRGTANAVVDAVKYVRDTTPPGEPMLAVPNMPVFYFLADRPHATRFVQMAQLVTNDHRAEAYRQLEGERPSLVLFHGGRNSVDNLLPSQQFAPILNHVILQYEPVTKFGPIYVLGRRPDGAGAREAGATPRYLAWQKPGVDAIKSLLDRPAAEIRPLPPGPRESCTIPLEDLTGQAYRTLRIRIGGKQPGTLSVRWRTREPLDAEERAAAAVVMLPGVHYDRTHDLDLRNHPSWQFNHIREVTIRFSAGYSRGDLTLVELLPMAAGAREAGAGFEPTPP